MSQWVPFGVPEQKGARRRRGGTSGNDGRSLQIRVKANYASRPSASTSCAWALIPSPCEPDRTRATCSAQGECAVGVLISSLWLLSPQLARTPLPSISPGVRQLSGIKGDRLSCPLLVGIHMVYSLHIHYVSCRRCSASLA